MLEYTKGGREVRIFDSIDDLLSTVKTIPDSRCAGLKAWRDPQMCGRSFSAWSEVFAACTEPLRADLEEVERMAEALRGSDMPQPLQCKRRIRWSEDDGDEIDKDRVSSGQPCWRSSHKALVPGQQTVTIITDVNARIGIPHKDILWRGAAALAMTDILEEAGYRVELWAVHRVEEVYEDGGGVFHAVKIKGAKDPVDLPAMTAVVSGWFLRSVMQRAKCLSKKTMVKGAGEPCPPYSLVDELGATDPIIISGTYSKRRAEYLAREALKKFAAPEPQEEEEPPVPLEEVKVAVETPKPSKPLTLAEIARERKRQEQDQKRWEKEAKAWKQINREE